MIGEENKTYVESHIHRWPNLNHFGTSFLSVAVACRSELLGGWVPELEDTSDCREGTISPSVSLEDDIVGFTSVLLKTPDSRAAFVAPLKLDFFVMTSSLRKAPSHFSPLFLSEK